MTATAEISKSAKDEQGWRSFKPGTWGNAIDVRDFINRNVTAYDGDEKFLVGSTRRTRAVWDKLQPYFQEERKKGVLAVDAKTPTRLSAGRLESTVSLPCKQPWILRCHARVSSAPFARVRSRRWWMQVTARSNGYAP